MSETSDLIRVQFKKADDIRDAGLTTPESIRRFDDIAYGEDAMQKLDVYRPKDAGDAVLPVIVSVHGGGWVYGDKERYQYYTMDLATRGFAVVNFSYRLAPESVFPAQLEDVCAAFRWTLDNAKAYGLDTKNLFAIGDSAGAHLLSLFCCLCTNPEYAARFDLGMPEGFCPKAVAFNCGCYRMAIDDPNTPEQTLLLMRDFLGKPVDDAALEPIDALRHITERFPQTFFFTATGDFLSAQARLLQGVLQEKRVPHVMRFYGDAEHRLGHVFNCGFMTEAARACNDEQCDFFRRLVK